MSTDRGPDRTRRLLFGTVPTWVALAGIAVVTGVAIGILVPLIGPSPGGGAAALAGDSVDAFRRAVEALGRRLSEIDWGMLLVGLLISTTNVLLRARGWRTILQAAYPGSRIRWTSLVGATYCGIGANAILPGRVGDGLRLFLVKRRVDGATYPTLATTLVAETTFDAVVGSCLLVWAWQAGFLPGVPQLPSLPLFEIAWYARHPWIVLIIVGVAVVVLLVAQHHVRRFWQRAAQGLRILTMPLLYLRGVVVYQALGWCCRVAAAWFFLRAFDVEASIGNALLIQVAGSLSTLIPATPGGLGPRQALIVVLLAGEASRSSLLALGVGMELALTAWNVLLGAISLTVLLRGVRLRRALQEARRR